MEKYTPKIIDDHHVEMLIHANPCRICKRIMIEKDKGNLFAHEFFNAQDSQMHSAGLVFESNIKIEGHYAICQKCADAGKADFLCALCNTRKKTDKIQESIGDPPEHLCKDCYNTITANVWEKKVDELIETHRYDYE